MTDTHNLSQKSHNTTPVKKEILPTFTESQVDKQNHESLVKALLQRFPDLNRSFHIFGKIGEGTFSNVFLASLKSAINEKKYAIKHLIPTCHPKSVKNELDCLYHIGGKDNIVSCEATLRQGDCVAIIMPYLQHQKFSDYVFDMTVEETRLYMKNLFLALRRVHSFNIIHRDIKPGNFLYNRERKQFLLVDFGVAQKVIDSNKPSVLRKQDILLKATGEKRKRENVSDNAEGPLVKRSALHSLSVGKNHQDILPSSNSSNVNKMAGTNQTFQSLVPQIKNLTVQKETSFVRIQNSQVQTGSLGLFPRPTAPVRRKDNCECSNKPRICNTCITRESLFAPRNGTRGFRPPEVLLKYPNQTTAVDMWAAGIIMLSILSGCYPFFRPPDDITALSQLITVFGSSAIINLARKLGRNVICSENCKPLNLLILCEYLRRRKIDGGKPQSGKQLCKDCKNPENTKYGCLCESKCKLDLSKTLFPKSAFDLLSKLLDINPDTRISAEMAMQHPFITGND